MPKQTTKKEIEHISEDEDVEQVYEEETDQHTDNETDTETKSEKTDKKKLNAHELFSELSKRFTQIAEADIAAACPGTGC